MVPARRCSRERLFQVGVGWASVLCERLGFDVFAGIAFKDLGVHPIGYETSMVVTIGLWLTVAPAIGAVSRVPIRKSKHR
jgi:hypothetical protein